MAVPVAVLSSIKETFPREIKINDNEIEWVNETDPFRNFFIFQTRILDHRNLFLIIVIKPFSQSVYKPNFNFLKLQEYILNKFGKPRNSFVIFKSTALSLSNHVCYYYVSPRRVTTCFSWMKTNELSNRKKILQSFLNFHRVLYECKHVPIDMNPYKITIDEFNEFHLIDWDSVCDARSRDIHSRELPFYCYFSSVSHVFSSKNNKITETKILEKKRRGRPKSEFKLSKPKPPVITSSEMCTFGQQDAINSYILQQREKMERQNLYQSVVSAITTTVSVLTKTIPQLVNTKQEIQCASGKYNCIIPWLAKSAITDKETQLMGQFHTRICSNIGKKLVDYDNNFNNFGLAIEIIGDLERLCELL